MHQVLGLLSHEHTAFALRYVYSEQENMNVFERNVCRDHMFIYIDNFLSLQTELKIMNFCLACDQKRDPCISFFDVWFSRALLHLKK